MLKSSLSSNNKPELNKSGIDIDNDNDKQKNEMAEGSTNSGKDNSQPNQPSQSISRLTTPVDEDWSIISSSSDLDIDDEQSTTSSQDYPQLIINNSTDLSILKVPEQHIPQTSSETPITTTKKHHQEGNSNLENSQTTISTPSESESDLELELESDSNSILSGGSNNNNSNNSNNNDNSLNVGSKIRFFENLTQLNDSIKQKSNQFYYDFAKIHLDNYIDDQQYRQEEEEEEGLEENLDDTIELFSNVEPVSNKKNANDVIDSSLSTTKSIQVNDLILKHDNNNNNSTNFVVNKSKPILVRAVQKLQIFLDHHSDYLYYYMMAAIVLGIIPVIYSVKYILVPKQVVDKPPMTTFDKLNQIWDHLLYEEEQEIITKKSIFFLGGYSGGGASSTIGKHKTNKLIKFINTLKYNLDDKVFPQYYVMVNKMNHYGDKFWKQSQDLGSLSYIKLKLWSDQSIVIFNKYSIIGLNKFDHYNQIGLNNFIKYRQMGLDNLKKFYDNAGIFSKKYRHNIIMGSSRILENIIFQSKQLKSLISNVSNVLNVSNVFNNKSFNDLKEITFQQWNQLINTYNIKVSAAASTVVSTVVSTASKFKSRLDKNAIYIYKFGKNLADSIKTELELTIS